MTSLYQHQLQQNQQNPRSSGSTQDYHPEMTSPELDYLIVLHDFESRSDDELSMRKGDHILVLETDQAFNDGWFIVSINLKRDIHPRSQRTNITIH